jgi:hypothetical protein
MRVLIVGLLIFLAAPATAKEAGPVASDQTGYIRALGRLNVNTATREQLLQVPGLDGQAVDGLLAAREKAPIADLSALALGDEIAAHLKTDGDSTFYRIRQNPLRRLDVPAAATTTSKR